MSTVRLEGTRPNLIVDGLKQELATWEDAFREYGDDFDSIKKGLENERLLNEAETARLQFEVEACNDAGNQIDCAIDQLLESYNKMRAALEQGGFIVETGDNIDIIGVPQIVSIQRPIQYDVVTCEEGLADHEGVDDVITINPALAKSLAALKSYNGNVYGTSGSVSGSQVLQQTP